MTLRTRVALLVAVVAAVVVAGVGFAAFRAVRAELRQEVDDDLLRRAELVSEPGRADLPTRRPGAPGRVPRADAFGVLVSFDAVARVIGPGGRVAVALDEASDELPVDEELLAAAADGPVLSDVDVAGVPHRLVTVGTPEGSFVQVARSLDEVQSVQRDVGRGIVVIGVVTVVAGALAAWVLAGRTVRPIVELTDTAEEVARTGDLTREVRGDGPDEVGRLAGAFATMLGALDASRRQQRRLVMDASHELRTPLTSLRTNVDVLRGGRLPEEERGAVLADVDGELAELSDLVAELVELATDVRADEPVQPLRLDEVAAPVVERARRRTGRPIALRVARPAVVEGRPEALARAVRNLVDNAAKFSPDGSPIEVLVEGGRLSVLDAGPGIPPEERERVFERFHRLEVTRDAPGSGLGLAIVEQVVAAHDGTVGVTESPLGGAAVWFRIPTVDD